MLNTTQTDPNETEFGGTTVKRIQPKMSVRIVVLLGLMIALTIVCERLLTWDTPITRVSLAFLPKAISGALLGPIYNAIVCGLSDILGCILKGYAINPYITFASVLRGVIYGVLLYRSHSYIRIYIAAILDHFVAGLIVTTFGLLQFGFGAWNQAFITARVLSCTVGFAVEIIILLAVGNQLFGLLKKVTADIVEKK